ncbi:ArfGAP with FG repeats 1, variant 3 [Chamberlinius hualienensis]
MANAYGKIVNAVDETLKMAASKRRQDEKHLKILRELGALLYNKQCFDCHQRGPTYLNMTIGSFVCTSCSGILRGLNPPHRVKSISMASFTPEEIEFIRNRGNEYCRREWMGTYDGQPPIESETKDEQRIKDFMMTKYERKRWYTDPSTFRHQPMPTALITSPPPPSASVNNMKQNTTTNNINIITQNTRPVMQSASFPPPNSLGKPSMDLLGATNSNANASFANFDNFVPVPTTDSSVASSLTYSNVETAFTDDDIPIVEKSFFSKLVGHKRSLGLPFFSSFGHKGATRIPSVEPKRISKSKHEINRKSPSFDQMTLSAQPSYFLGPSNSSHTTSVAPAAATNNFADSAFGGIASPSSNPSSTTAAIPPRPPPITNSPSTPIQPAVNQQITSFMTSADRYAALADLDSIFNSSNNGTNSSIDWDAGPKSNSSTAWGINCAFSSVPQPIHSSSSLNKDFEQAQTPSNPFTGMNFNSTVWNQKPNVPPAPSPSNPFAASIMSQTGHVSSTSPEPYAAFSNPANLMNNYPVGPTNMAWANSTMAVPTPFLSATNGNYPSYKANAQPQFGFWQPSIGNPFAAVVSAPQKTNSSNPFL